MHVEFKIEIVAHQLQTVGTRMPEVSVFIGIYERGRQHSIKLTELLGCDPTVVVSGGGYNVRNGVVEFEVEVEGHMQLE